MGDWLALIADKVKDVTALAFIREQVAILEERIRLREDNIHSLERIIAEFESKLDACRKESTLVSEQLAQAIEELEKFRLREKYQTVMGIAFKRGENQGDYDNSPFCPNCFSHLSNPGDAPLSCSNCGYTVKFTPGYAYRFLRPEEG